MTGCVVSTIVGASRHKTLESRSAPPSNGSAPRVRRTSGAFTVLVAGASSPAAAAHAGEEFAKDAKVTFEQARKGRSVDGAAK